MLPEIGSNFWNYSTELPENEHSFFWVEYGWNSQYYKSGRNALKALCRNIVTNNKMALLPSYTCGTVIEPFIEEGWGVGFYQINRDLTINLESFYKEYFERRPSIVLVHSYFGFDTIQDDCFLLQCKEDDVIIIEDLTQALFSEHNITYADYYVTSFRKFFAIPDGGALISRNPLAELNSEGPDEQILSVALDAFNFKKQYMENPSSKLKELFRYKYQQLNDLIEENSCIRKMNPFSKRILTSCDNKRIVEKRRENYKTLLGGLSSIEEIQPVWNGNLVGCTPLYFPVYVDNREPLQAFACKNNIYCPVIWPKSKFVTNTDSESDYIYEHILCIPIDQRYGIEEMNRIIDLFQSFYSK